MSVAVGDRRESAVVKQARMMLARPGSPDELPALAWAEVLRGVLAERDEIGEWLQRMLDAEYLRGKPDGWPDACARCGARGGHRSASTTPTGSTAARAAGRTPTNE